MIKIKKYFKWFFTRRWIHILVFLTILSSLEISSRSTVDLSADYLTSFVSGLRYVPVGLTTFPLSILVFILAPIKIGGEILYSIYQNPFRFVGHIIGSYIILGFLILTIYGIKKLFKRSEK